MDWIYGGMLDIFLLFYWMYCFFYMLLIEMVHSAIRIDGQSVHVSHKTFHRKINLQSAYGRKRDRNVCEKHWRNFALFHRYYYISSNRWNSINQPVCFSWKNNIYPHRLIFDGNDITTAHQKWRQTDRPTYHWMRCACNKYLIVVGLLSYISYIDYLCIIYCFLRFLPTHAHAHSLSHE